jgi:hypothetical protein
MRTVRQHSRASHPALSLLAFIVQRARGLCTPKFDPGVLTEAQRRDAGIDDGDVERARLLTRPLIR